MQIQRFGIPSLALATHEILPDKLQNILGFRFLRFRRRTLLPVVNSYLFGQEAILLGRAKPCFDFYISGLRAKSPCAALLRGE